jgi:hypothetical protein
MEDRRPKFVKEAVSLFEPQDRCAASYEKQVGWIGQNTNRARTNTTRFLLVGLVTDPGFQITSKKFGEL